VVYGYYTTSAPVDHQSKGCDIALTSAFLVKLPGTEPTPKIAELRKLGI